MFTPDASIEAATSGSRAHRRTVAERASRPAKAVPQEPAPITATGSPARLGRPRGRESGSVSLARFFGLRNRRRVRLSQLGLLAGRQARQVAPVRPCDEAGDPRHEDPQRSPGSRVQPHRRSRRRAGGDRRHRHVSRQQHDHAPGDRRQRQRGRRERGKHAGAGRDSLAPPKAGPEREHVPNDGGRAIEHAPGGVGRTIQKRKPKRRARSL